MRRIKLLVLLALLCASCAKDTRPTVDGWTCGDKAYKLEGSITVCADDVREDTGAWRGNPAIGYFYKVNRQDPVESRMACPAVVTNRFGDRWECR